MDSLKTAIESSELGTRELGLGSVTALCKDVGPTVQPFLTALLPVILNAYADKVRCCILPELARGLVSCQPYQLSG